jgi:hypothetical protein
MTDQADELQAKVAELERRILALEQLILCERQGSLDTGRYGLPVGYR